MPIRFAVIGGGAVGVFGALEAAKLGADVTLVAEGEIGGRATWDSLVPSKVLLTAADTLLDARLAQYRGVKGHPVGVGVSDLMERIRQRTQQWGQAQRQSLDKAGVRVVHGVAAFADEHTLAIRLEGGGEERITFDRALIATGSVPIFPPSMKPDGKRILAPRFMSSLQSLPEHLVVVGGGVTGSEFAYLFRALGAQVALVTDMPHLLPRTDEDISRLLEHAFRDMGINVLLSSPAESVTASEDGVVVTLRSGQELKASHAFIAIGRRADLDRLHANAAGVQTTVQGVVTNEYLQSSAPHIYAAGDVAGPPSTVNHGWAQAQVAVRHALGVAVSPFDPKLVMEAIYSQPQVAQVGIGEAQARERGIRAKIVHGAYAGNLKAQLLGETEGMVKLVYEEATGKLLGGSAIGAHAAEVLTPLATALALGGTIETLASLFPAHPTLGEVLFDSARGV